MLGILVVWLVTSVSLFIISKVPFIGVEIVSFEKAMISAAVFGILNAILGGILRFLALPFNFLTLGLVFFLINAFIFGLAAKLVEGFRLKNGIASAILGALALSILNSLIFRIL
ncbi:phage holin family protein [Synechococcus sp. PCC 7336]|uniref:phage holin family protein n=1 Tax=Synechococcus sp. PCC 7336 TaxID=195250 RepID=UPI000377AF9A|nr:phage holin family protein [Synechococcus sp. PCC 7336]